MHMYMIALIACYILQPDPYELAPNELELYHQAKQIRLPTQVPASAGGLNKTSEDSYRARLKFEVPRRIVPVF